MLKQFLQELIQKEKVDIDGEKGAQINVVAKKIVNIWMIQNYEQEVQTSYTLYLLFIFSLLYYFTD